MYRPASKTAPTGHGGSPRTKSTPGNLQQRNTGANDDNAVPSTIREIRSRTGQPAAGASMTARQLIANKRQAMSMERLNGANPAANSNHGTNPNTAQNSASMHNISGLVDKEKCSSISGSSNSINGSTASSPSRGSSASSAGTLNRTASRVSRFRSAKAVFERLSSANANANATSRLDKSSLSERPRGTVASRYAAAAAARGLAAQQLQQQTNSNNLNATSSPRSRLTTAGKSSIRAQGDSLIKPSSSNRPPSSSTRTVTTGSNSAMASRPDAHPKPQPRVITTTTRKSLTTASHTATTSSNPQDSSANVIKSHRAPAAPSSSVSSKTNQQSSAKPPPKDLIDKIVLEIARDADKEHDANCTIQDLSNCDISGIPETLDFDKCFQDVEMMTEEEARKLLSRKSESDVSTLTGHESPLVDEQGDAPRVIATICNDQNTSSSNSAAQTNQQAFEPSQRQADTSTSNLDQSTKSSDSLIPPAPSAATLKYKVRFSDEPVTVFSTHAVEDYDRRNDDIDPVAASAEYEIEKSRERDGLKDDSDDEEADATKNDTSHNNAEAANISGKFTSTFKSATQNLTTTTTTTSLVDDGQQQLLCEITTLDHAAARSLPGAQGASQTLHSAAGRDPYDRTPSSVIYPAAIQHHVADDDDEAAKKKYIEFLERELSLKRILEQNLRDLQSQYYETVKQLDSTKSQSETKIAELKQSLAELGTRFEANQNELEDSRDQAGRLDKELKDIKDSSQLLEKKYHRAKKIIKDMQSRDESFTRREQLYQQKLDEIEYELGVLISTIDKTIHDEGLRYFSISDSSPGCLRQHQARLDVFGLIRQMLENFGQAQSTQSAQIKQRIVSMLEQQLANLLALSNGATSVTGPAAVVPPSIGPVGNSHYKQSNNKSGDNNLTLAKTNKNADHLSSSNNNNNNNDSNKQYQKSANNYASHRLSQPNMPHPIGVGGQPTKIFHSIAPSPNPAALTSEHSPPQSVNSYPSSNSLNSLNNNNNNNNQQLVNNNLVSGPKLRDLANEPTMLAAVPLPIPSHEEHFKSKPDTQAPYQTDEWHEKPVSEWTTHQVSTWLLALGLDQYISKFEDRNVNGQSLINLDSTVLKGLGVLNSNDRNLLKKKIRELRVEMEKERKQNEKKLKENLKEKSKVQAPSQSSKQASWKKGLLS